MPFTINTIHTWDKKSCDKERVLYYIRIITVLRKLTQNDVNDDFSGTVENVAGVICHREMADLVFDHIELMRTAHLEDRQLYWLQCAMEENCVASQAYKVQRESANWHLETRRLLRFTARILNAGTADFRPSVPKHLWEWHMCHMWVTPLIRRLSKDHHYRVFLLINK